MINKKINIPKVTLKNKIEMPVLGLGTYLLKGEECYNAVKIALNLGYTHIDTAAYYNNHVEIGKAIKGYDRKKLFITSKVWIGNLHYNDVLKSCYTALKEMETPYFDLYLIHYPYKKIPIKETIEAMAKLYNEKKIRAFGVSNFTIKHLKDAMAVSKLPLCINQVEFHSFLYQKELLSFCLKNHIYITAYSPLARGLVNNDNTIKEIAKKYNKTPTQISLRWLIEKKIIAIPKGSSDEHIKENMSIFDFKLKKSDIEKIDNLPQSRLVNPDFAEFDYE